MTRPRDAAAEPVGGAAPVPKDPRARFWPGRTVPFRLEPVPAPLGDPAFDRRLALTEPAAGWIVLTYADDPLAPPTRPVLRVLRPGGPDDFVLPGAGHGRAHWLGRLPRDAGEIRFAAGPGFVLERVGLRAEAGILGQCLLRRPWRFAAALYERARGSERRYRDILRGACAVTPLAGFEAWAASRARPVRAPAVRLRVRCLILDPADDAAALARTADALARQTHADWTAVAMGAHASASGTASGPVTRRAWDPALSPVELLGEADALCVWEAGDEPAPDALALLAAALGGADLAYADAVGPDGAPHLKPDWSPDFALATGYAGRPCLLSRALIARLPGAGLGPLAGAAGALDVAAALAAREAVHLPRILARTAPDTPDAAGRAAAIDRGLAAVGAPARAAIRGGSVEIVWPLPSPAPRVSVVIPSRDRLDLIGRVCRGVLHETAYPDIELVIVDNGSVEPAVLAHYDALRRDPRVRILADPRPFNFAAMVNAGVEAATGTVVVLLNNDVAVLEPGWLEALVRQACRPGVGAVGAKLLYGDGRLQHAGVVVGLGGRAGHILRRRPGDTPGHLGRLRTAHEVSAVTAACLAVARDTYRAVGGLDAEAFPVDFNDVDFCLRLGAAGWKTVWTPAATLAHLESVSRGPSVGEKRARFEREAARFSERWRAVIRHDPYYHPALSLTTFGEDLE